MRRKRSSNWSNKVEKSKYGTTNSGSKLDKGYVGHKVLQKAMKRAKNIESRHRGSRFTKIRTAPQH